MGFIKLFCHRIYPRTFLKVCRRNSYDASIYSNYHEPWFHQTTLPLQNFLLVRNCSNTSQKSTSNDKYVSFSDMIQFRWNQARCSVLIELSSKDEASYAASLCKSFGNVKSFLSYPGDQTQVFLLTEYENEESAKQFIRACQVKNISSSFPLYSRLVCFERKKKRNNNVEHLDREITDVSKQSIQVEKNLSVNDAISSIYDKETLTDLSTRLRFLFSCIMEDALKGLFPNCAGFPFGSSINGFGREGCDLDLMIRLYPDKLNDKSEFCFQSKAIVGDLRSLQQRSISCIYEILRQFFPGVSYIQRILGARIPILKFRHKILNLECDISVNNMSAVYMSEVLYFLGELDPRVRHLVFAVKKWAKLTNITYESPGSWITNFSLTLLVIFYLQNCKPAILPPLNKAIDLSECQEIGAFHAVKYIGKPEKWKSIASQNNENLGALLEGFLHFLATFEFNKNYISLILGQAVNFDNGYPLWIQYPLEEDLNVSKNVSSYEIQQLVSVARATANNLNIQRTSDFQGDFDSLLGLTTLKEKFERIDISALYEEPNIKKDKTIQRVR